MEERNTVKSVQQSVRIILPSIVNVFLISHSTCSKMEQVNARLDFAHFNTRAKALYKSVDE